jgi:hypothetical protein
MRVIIEFPDYWNASQVVAILDLLELLHAGLRDHYALVLREALAEHPEPRDELTQPEFDDDIPF